MQRLIFKPLIFVLTLELGLAINEDFQLVQGKRHAVEKQGKICKKLFKNLYLNIFLKIFRFSANFQHSHVRIFS